MRLHYYYYTASTPYLGVHHHHPYGHGFGSIFARLFSKVAAKTAAKTALTAAKVAGRKVLKVAVKQGTQLAKEVAKKGLEEAKTLGKDLAVQGINALGETAINKGIPADLVHNVSNIAQEGAHTAVDRLGTKADKRIDKIATRPVSSGKRISQASSIHVAPTSVPIGGSKIQNHRRRQQQQHRKRKRQIYSNPQSTSKGAKFSLINDIEEA